MLTGKLLYGGDQCCLSPSLRAQRGSERRREVSGLGLQMKIYARTLGLRLEIC